MATCHVLADLKTTRKCIKKLETMNYREDDTDELQRSMQTSCLSSPDDSITNEGDLSQQEIVNNKINTGKDEIKNHSNLMKKIQAKYGYEDKTQEIIMNLATWGRCNKKTIKNKNLNNCTQSIFSKENLATLHEVRELGEAHKERTGFEFAYATWNCGLLMKINGTCRRFSTVDEAKRLLGITEDNLNTVIQCDDKVVVNAP